MELLSINMVKMIHLFRIPNLLIVLATQSLVFFGLIKPGLAKYQLNPETNNFWFFILMLLTCLIMVGAYIINDIFDVYADALNKKNKQVVGKIISIPIAKIAYVSIVLIGLLIVLFSVFQGQLLHFAYLYPLITAILALYSSHLKRTVLAGNVVVALLSSWVVGIVLLFESQSLRQLSQLDDQAYRNILLINIAFIVFAFLSSLYREIVKDIEDIQGDKLNNIRTTAVVLGENTSRKMAGISGILLFVCIFYWIFADLNRANVILVLYPIILLLMPLSLSLFKMWKATHKKDYTIVSKLIKLIMASGLIYLMLYAKIIYL